MTCNIARFDRPSATNNMRENRLPVLLTILTIPTILLIAISNPASAQARGPFQMRTPPPGWSPGQYVKYAFTPNDPYYANQWHLENTGGYPDVNVVPAWNRDLTGAGVTIGIVDDSLQSTHPDLSPNYVAADSYDFADSDPVPDPVLTDDNHGTSVGGVAAARGGNAIGVSGAAPWAGLAGLRTDLSLSAVAAATLYHSSGANTNIKVKNHSYGHDTPYVSHVSTVNALITSDGAGTIHAFAAGNERAAHSYYYDVDGSGGFTPDVDMAVDADANKKHDQSTRQTLTIGALGADSVFSSYSSWGANLVATTPSNGALGLGIVTADRTGADGYNDGSEAIGDADYTDSFGGTSSASPLAAGIMALGKQANTALNGRMAKHLLALTSFTVDPSDANPMGGWNTNAAGVDFNQNYGFGLIDADAFTQQAVNYVGVTSEVSETTGTVAVGAAIPDNGDDATTVSRTFNLANPGGLPLEDVEVHLDVTHTWRGNVQAVLTSPGGTASRLMYQNGADSWNNIDWTFASNEFWGEDPAGTWTLELQDWVAGDVGTWNSYSMTAYTGELVPVANIDVMPQSRVGIDPSTPVTRGPGDTVQVANTAVVGSDDAKLENVSISTDRYSDLFTQNGTPFTNGQLIVPGATASTTIQFDKTGLLNGAVVTGSFSFDVTGNVGGTQAVHGETGTHTYSLSATVSGNMGDGMAIVNDQEAYAGLSSTSDETLGGTAAFRGGANKNSDPETITLAWRPANPGNDPVEGMFVSDVVDLDGISNDIFILEMSWDPQKLIDDRGDIDDLADAQQFAVDGEVFVMTNLGTPGTPQWVHASDATTLGDLNENALFLGVKDDFGDFTIDQDTPGLEDDLGRWGVVFNESTTVYTAFVVTDHNSEFAVIPEPGGLLLALFGLVGTCSAAWRRRRR